ncbi:MAG TPA: cysteine desulfurase [Candidatus Nanoarchaeia archaeon]
MLENIEKIRSDFPILGRQIYGKKLVYFDNAATSQKPKAVIEAIADYYRTSNANVHRGVHKLSEEATEGYEAARKRVANFVNAGDARQIIFTRNATEAINLVAYAWGRKNIKKGEEILLTEMEHHSNLVPWQILAAEVGAKLKFIPIDENGELSWRKSLHKLVTNKTKLAALTHVSNVLGTINPVKEIIEDIRNLKSDVRILIDGAQAVPHLPVSIQTLGCDFYVFTGHKMLGPTGIGVLWARKDLLEEMPPFLGGGDMILEVGFEKSTYNYIPWKFEAGTPHIAGAIGLAAACDYLAKVGMKKVREHEQELTAYAQKALSEIKNLVIYGPKKLEKRAGVISFNIVDKKGKVAIHPHDLASILDGEGIALRSGHHCAQPLMKVLGINAAARASFALYNTKEEIDRLRPAIEKAKEIMRA